jgi:hypothetical protein
MVQGAFVGWNEMSPMATRLAIGIVLLGLAVLGGCSAGESAEPPDSSGEAAPPPSPPSEEVVTLGRGEVELEAGIHRLDLTALAPKAATYPPFLVTVPDGWVSMGGWILARPVAGPDDAPVAILFWDVERVYGHPCSWMMTLEDPGPGVDDLVAALVEVPMRDPTEPAAAEIDGRAGMYLEWSVPADIAFDEGGNFPDCDGNAQHRDFVSWTASGWASNRYHQGPGQLDRLWILDVDGERLVIDAFSMPTATEAEIQEMVGIVESIRFDG